MNRDSWKDYFAFSKRERIAVSILFTIIVVFLILPYFFHPQFKKPVVDARLQKQLLSAEILITNKDISREKGNASELTNTSPNATKPQLNLFYFDPNTLDASGWKMLGIRDKTIQTIINYRNKGGYFKKAGDIRKIYGLKKQEADALIPYINIKASSPITAENINASTGGKEHFKSKQAPKTININTATAEEFKSLPGIGDVLSNRIVKFRNSINGFNSIKDIKRTYGLSDSTFQLILPYLMIKDSSTFRK